MASYNLSVVRELLSQAFGVSGIEKLAFDLFQPVYQNFASGMTRDQMIRDIVTHAAQHGRLEDLLNYVKENNRYQYDIYLPKLETPSGATPGTAASTAFQERRLQDIQRNIEREMKLLNQYEEQLTYEDDPRRMAGIRREITRQKEALDKYYAEAAEIQALLGETETAVAGQVQASLDTFGQKLDHLSQQMSGLEQQVEAGQQAILTRIDKRHQGTVSKLLQQMKADQLQLVNQLEEAIEQGEIARREGRELSHQLEIMLEELIEKFSDHPDAQQWESLLSLLEQQTSWQQKLKLTIPIVPGILEFESEAAVDVKDALKGAWNRLISKFKS